MLFDELDAKMRVFETNSDTCVLPHLFMVIRLDGRGFTKLTKEKHDFERPFDPKFRDLMIGTVQHLMTNCGFNVIYGFTESDEISLLCHPQENSFGRKTRKLLSILSGEASAYFSLQLGAIGVFDSRISQLPRVQDVIDYFRWRAEDALRNALNAHCYWLLRKEGQTAIQASKALESLGIGDKNELLFQRNINFSSLPAWQKRGIGLYWEDYMKEGLNPKTQTTVLSQRRRIKVDMEIPTRNEYDLFIQNIVETALQSEITT